jgi:hypothetical protein
MKVLMVLIVSSKWENREGERMGRGKWTAGSQLAALKKKTRGKEEMRVPTSKQIHNVQQETREQERGEPR